MLFRRKAKKEETKKQKVYYFEKEYPAIIFTNKKPDKRHRRYKIENGKMWYVVFEDEETRKRGF